MLTGIFDSHAHYDDAQFDADRDILLAQTLPASGVSCVVNVGNDDRSIASSLALSEQYDYIYCTVGHHPHTAKDVREGYLEELRTYAQRPKVVAIGEIGLDYHYDFSPRTVQREVFAQQLRLAVEIGMPVIIHSREATEDTLTLLREFRPSGVVHCFSGSAETAKEILALGMYIGFTGSVTFKNAKKVAAAAAVVPRDRLLVETDCPYMAPVPHRGQRCDSTLLPDTLAVLAAIRGEDLPTLVLSTAENARRLYRLGSVSGITSVEGK